MMRNPRYFRHPSLFRWTIRVSALLILFFILQSEMMHGRQFAIMLVALPMLLLLPGGLVTLIFFPMSRDAARPQKGEREMDMIERATLAVLFSIVLISALVWVLNRGGDVWLRPAVFIFFLIPLIIFLAAVAWRRNNFVFLRSPKHRDSLEEKK